MENRSFPKNPFFGRMLKVAFISTLILAAGILFVHFKTDGSRMFPALLFFVAIMGWYEWRGFKSILKSASCPQCRRDCGGTLRDGYPCPVCGVNWSLPGK